MKKFISISFFTWLFVMFSYPLFVEAAMPERKQLFDDNWRFKLGDTPDAPSLAYNDVGWRSLDLPHDWSGGSCRKRWWLSAYGYWMVPKEVPRR